MADKGDCLCGYICTCSAYSTSSERYICVLKHQEYHAESMKKSERRPQNLTESSGYATSSEAKNVPVKILNNLFPSTVKRCPVCEEKLPNPVFDIYSNVWTKQPHNCKSEDKTKDWIDVMLDLPRGKDNGS